jgi:hypothetical protein
VSLGKIIGRIAFIFGFVGSVLFYSFQYTFESHFLCPLCLYVDVAFVHPLLWLQIGLGFGLIQGLMFALLGFGAGYSISKINNSL